MSLRIFLGVFLLVAFALFNAVDAGASTNGAAVNLAANCSDVYARLMAAAKQPKCEAGTYLLGGGHGGILGKDVQPTNKLDCSSGVSLVLKLAGIFPDNHAWVSGAFGKWGTPGKGQSFTVYWSDGHVWIDLGRNQRLDTNGAIHTRPCLQTGSRSTSGFNAVHYPGC